MNCSYNFNFIKFMISDKNTYTIDEGKNHLNSEDQQMDSSLSQTARI